jgi:hypothetical protein
MRFHSAPVMALVGLLALASTVARAEKTRGKNEKELMPESINRQFAWEEKVVGPKSEKSIDHAKIAALQQQAKKQEEEQRNRPAPKPTRAEGVAAPASVVLPTMDIEKPAPAGSIRRPGKKTAAAEPAKAEPDAIDALLAQNRTETTAATGDRGMKKVLAASSKNARNKKFRGKRSARRSMR